MAEYHQEEIEVGNYDGVFASPWEGSDLVLVVEDQELHVHKWILKSQSPVFKTMFEGDFQEAGQDRIALGEKNFKSMVEFLKVLYPSSMFGEEKADFNDECLLSILALADEYQCVNLIKQCINEAKITPKNVVEILPYVVKYHKTALPRLYDVMKWATPMFKLEALVLPQLESKEGVLLTKCRFLESAMIDLQNAVIYLMGEFLREANHKTRIVGECSLHQILSFPDLDKTKTCQYGAECYKDNFIPPFNSCSNKHTLKKNLLNLLQQSNDITDHALTNEEKQIMEYELENVIL